MASPLAAAAGWPCLAWHARRRRPRSPGLILITGRRFDLPAEGRFGLLPAPAAGAGRHVARLVFSDLPGSGLLVLADQLEPAEWRLLRLAIGRSA